MSAAITHEELHGQAHDHAHEAHPKQSFIYKYIFSTDHKVIGIQYGLTSLVFLLAGFFLMMVMRWSIAYPDKPMPFIGTLLGDRWAPGGVVSPELYNMFGAMHGTIMVFLGVVPLAFGAFGNYLVPLQIGAIDMAFPKLNAWSYWLNLIGGVLMMMSFFMPSGAAQSGWTNYSPLASTTQMDVKDVFFSGQTQWLLAMVFLISSSLLV